MKSAAHSAHVSLFLVLSVFLISPLGELWAQSENKSRQPVQTARLHSELVWQRTSPTQQQPEGPVLYTIIMRSSATPGHIPSIANNYTLTNSSISDDGTLVAIGGLSITSASGMISFAGGQAFPGTVTSVTGGDSSVTIGGTSSAPTVAVNTGTLDNRWLKLGGGTMTGNITFNSGQPLAPNGPAGGSLSGSYPNPGIAGGAVLAGNIAAGQVVKNLNGLSDQVTLAAGFNVSITPSGGNTLTIATTSSSGTVTSVGSGLGLTGGPITGSGTLAIDPAVVPQLGVSNSFSNLNLFRTGVQLPPTGTATTGQGFNSSFFDIFASAYNTGAGSAVNEKFRWQAEPVGNNTATPSATLNLLFAPGGAIPAETGLSIASTGIISFAGGQSFPGLVTSVAAGDSSITIGGSASAPTVKVATGGVTNSDLQNSSLTVTAGTGLTGGGTVALGGSTSLAVNTSQFAPASGSGNYIQNQIAAPQTAGFSITGSTLSGTPNTSIVQSGMGTGLAVQSTSAAAGVNPALTVTETSTNGTAISASTMAAGGTAISAASGGVAIFGSGGTAGLFNTGFSGNILVGQNGGTNEFRVDFTGKGFFNGGTQVGGADFAESVAVRGQRQLYEPGDVLVIDSNGARRLARSSEPYSTLVAGIVSTKPGMLASRYAVADEHSSKAMKDEVPLAIVGIVPCKVSAENGAIHPGDLLVTAGTAGYAMKGTDRTRMLGAVVGKAMQPLEAATGTIEVLVTLQ